MRRKLTAIFLAVAMLGNTNVAMAADSVSQLWDTNGPVKISSVCGLKKNHM